MGGVNEVVILPRERYLSLLQRPSTQTSIPSPHSSLLASIGPEMRPQLSKLLHKFRSLSLSVDEEGNLETGIKDFPKTDIRRLFVPPSSEASSDTGERREGEVEGGNGTGGEFAEGPAVGPSLSPSPSSSLPPDPEPVRKHPKVSTPIPNPKRLPISRKPIWVNRYRLRKRA